VLWDAINSIPEKFRFIRVEDRVAVFSGIGLVVSTLPNHERVRMCDSMMKVALNRLGHWSFASQQKLANSRKYLGDAIAVTASIFQTFAYPSETLTKNLGGVAESQWSGEDTRSNAQNFIRDGWPHITVAATLWGDDEVRQTTSNYITFYSEQGLTLEIFSRHI
jgi:hypothetical protein